MLIKNLGRQRNHTSKKENQLQQHSMAVEATDTAKPLQTTQKRLVFFMMRRNSSSLTSPSPSRSASSIISWSSSSVILSPSSLATRLRFLKEILPVSSSSNKRNALRISSFGSRLRIL